MEEENIHLTQEAIEKDLDYTNKVREELVAYLEDYHPYDYGYLLGIMKIIFKHWQHYYTEKDNVWGIDPEDAPTREEIANKLVELMATYENSSFDNEAKNLENLLDYLKEHLMYMWD